MDQSTCSTPECERPIQRRQWCNMHYKRMLKAGGLPPRVGTCEDCGNEYQGPKAGPLPGQCDPCRSPRTDCVGCGTYIGLTQRAGGRGVARAPLYCSEDCKPRCAVADCERPVRKRGWCANHYAAWRAHGDPEAQLAYTWATAWLCKTCGNTDRSTWQTQRRTFCRETCRITWAKYSGNVPESFDCATCGVAVNYYNPETGKRLRKETAYCGGCARAARTYMSAAALAAEDGTDCKLCGDPVDMNKTRTMRWHPSVDHIVPRALGGGDERSNLQLAHHGCNASKRHRYVA